MCRTFGFPSHDTLRPFFWTLSIYSTVPKIPVVSYLLSCRSLSCMLCMVFDSDGIIRAGLIHVFFCHFLVNGNYLLEEVLWLTAMSPSFSVFGGFFLVWMPRRPQHRKKCCLIFNRTHKSCWEIETGLETSVSDPLRTAALKQLCKAGKREWMSKPEPFEMFIVQWVWRGRGNMTRPSLSWKLIASSCSINRKKMVLLLWHFFCLTKAGDTDLSIIPCIHTHTHVKVVENSCNSSVCSWTLSVFFRNTSIPFKTHSVSGSIAVIYWTESIKNCSFARFALLHNVLAAVPPNFKAIVVLELLFWHSVSDGEVHALMKI